MRTAAQLQLHWREQAAASLAASIASKPLPAYQLPLIEGYETGEIPTLPARSLAAVSAPLARRYCIQRSPEQRSPDRQASIARRRQHAATAPLPPSLATKFTTGEIAVLKIIADEWLAHGACDLSQNEIGARAGVVKSVVKRAIFFAENDHSMITVQRRPRSGRKHLTNIIRIIRAEWRDWLSKGHRRAYAIAACDRAKPIFAEARGAEKNPPRVQVLRNSNSDPVDKTVKKGKSDRRWSRRTLF